VFRHWYGDTIAHVVDDKLACVLARMHVGDEGNAIVDAINLVAFSSIHCCYGAFAVVGFEEDGEVKQFVFHALDSTAICRYYQLP
jgi:hypothetical protein